MIMLVPVPNFIPVLEMEEQLGVSPSINIDLTNRTAENNLHTNRIRSYIIMSCRLEFVKTCALTHRYTTNLITFHDPNNMDKIPLEGLNWAYLSP